MTSISKKGTDRHSDNRYALSPDRALADEIRRIGKETEGGVFIRCRYCDEDPQLDDPAFCPNCGDAFEENTIGDVDWPLRVGVGPRLDILWEVKQKTGIESPDQLLDFPDDAEVLFDVLSYRDGTFDVDTHSF